MANRQAISSYQPSWQSYERQGPRLEPDKPRHGKRSAAIVGLLLASAAGVYAFRQFAGPVYGPEELHPEAPVVEAPEQGLDQLAPAPAMPVPLAAAPPVVATRPLTPRAAKPVSPAPREVASRTQSRPSFDAAFPVDGSSSISSGSLSARLEPLAAAPPARPAVVPNPAVAPQDPAAESGSKAVDAGAPLLLASEQEPLADAAFAAGEPQPESKIEGREIELASVAPVPEPDAAATDVSQGDDLLAASDIPRAIDDDAAPTGVSGALADARQATEPASVLAPSVEDKASERPPVQLALRAERALARRPASVAAQTVDHPQAVPARPAAQAMAPEPATGAAAPAAGYVQHFPMVVLNGTPLGAITLREFQGDRRQIHLGALLSLFKLKMDATEYERLISSVAADQFVNLEDLRGLGLDTRYDARRGRLIVGSPSER